MQGQNWPNSNKKGLKQAIYRELKAFLAVFGTIPKQQLKRPLAHIQCIVHCSRYDFWNQQNFYMLFDTHLGIFAREKIFGPSLSGFWKLKMTSKPSFSIKIKILWNIIFLGLYTVAATCLRSKFNKKVKINPPYSACMTFAHHITLFLRFFRNSGPTPNALSWPASKKYYTTQKWYIFVELELRYSENV